MKVVHMFNESEMDFYTSVEPEPKSTTAWKTATNTTLAKASWTIDAHVVNFYQLGSLLHPADTYQSKTCPDKRTSIQIMGQTVTWNADIWHLAGTQTFK